jgi:hypothetical protein
MSLDFFLTVDVILLQDYGWRIPGMPTTDQSRHRACLLPFVARRHVPNDDAFAVGGVETEKP